MGKDGKTILRLVILKIVRKVNGKHLMKILNTDQILIGDFSSYKRWVLRNDVEEMLLNLQQLAQKKDTTILRKINAYLNMVK